MWGSLSICCHFRIRGAICMKPYDGYGSRVHPRERASEMGTSLPMFFNLLRKYHWLVFPKQHNLMATGSANLPAVLSPVQLLPYKLDWIAYRLYHHPVTQPIPCILQADPKISPRRHPTSPPWSVTSRSVSAPLGGFMLAIFWLLPGDLLQNTINIYTARWGWILQRRTFVVKRG